MTVECIWMLSFGSDKNIVILDCQESIIIGLELFLKIILKLIGKKFKVRIFLCNK